MRKLILLPVLAFAAPALAQDVPDQAGEVANAIAACKASRSRRIASGSTVTIWSPMKASLGSSTASATKAGSLAAPASVWPTASITA